MSPVLGRSAHALVVLAAAAAIPSHATAQSLASTARAVAGTETLAPDVRPVTLAADERLPRPFDDVSPAYPEAMARRNADGDVVAEFVVAADGRPRMRSFVVIQSTDNLFATAVWDAVAQSRYVPAEAHGEPVPMAIRRVYRFRMAGAGAHITQPRIAR